MLGGRVITRVGPPLYSGSHLRSVMGLLDPYLLRSGRAKRRAYRFQKRPLLRQCKARWDALQSFASGVHAWAGLSGGHFDRDRSVSNCRCHVFSCIVAWITAGSKMARTPN